MKLWSSPATPFGRKATIVAKEHGLALEIVDVNPFESDALAALNPAKLIPVLEWDDGTVLYDSDVICRYFDEIGAGPTLYPDADKWDWQRRMTLGQTLTETSVAWVLQKRLPEDQQSARLKAHYEARADRITACLEGEAETLAAAPFRMDHVTVVCGLGHLEFRHNAEWRGRCPSLTQWYESILTRPSVAETMPVG